MTIKERIDSEMKDAMRQKDTVKLSTIRMLKAAVKNEEIAQIKELDDEGVMTVIQREAKKRKEAAEEFKKANRQDLSDKEEAELKILMAYLPAQATDEEIKAVVKAILDKIPPGTKFNMGMVMPEAMKQLKGKADGKKVSAIINELREQNQ